MDTLEVAITRPSSEELRAAGRVLGAAFVSSPIERSVRGKIDDGQRRRLVREYTAVCRLPGRVAVATRDDRIVGAIRWVESPGCRLGWSQKLKMTPTAVAAFGRDLPRAMKWVAAWSERDPSQPHVHLGPIGVEPAFQGRGIGSQMLAMFCEQLDRAGDAGYLETDKPENVRLYQRFGFEVRCHAYVLGVRNWFMWRDPARWLPVVSGR